MFFSPRSHLFLLFFFCCPVGKCEVVAQQSRDEGVGAGGGIASIVSSNAGGSYFNGLSIAEVTGATKFYENGYTGTRAVAAVVEAGSVWNGHDTLGHVSQFFDARDTYSVNNVEAGQLGEFDRHTTWVGHSLAGRLSGASPGMEYERGIAYGASLWSGAIATSFSNSGGFSWSRGYAFTDAYAGVAIDGVNGRTADVVNSSWGGASLDDLLIRGGNGNLTVAYDGMAKQSRAIFVASAGNSHNDNPDLNVGFLANGYNGIAVGALGSDLSNSPYSSIASFSTRGAQDYNGPDGFATAVRAVVDISAPGQNLTLASYGGLTGSNKESESDPTEGASNFYSPNVAGTSFSSPFVAGGASLLVDVAYSQFSANVENAKDGQVIKAILLNSADKPTGWYNGQQELASGVVSTTQSLDYRYGSGNMNLSEAYDQFVEGTIDLTGVSGGEIEELGWDYGEIQQDSFNDYVFSDTLQGGTYLTATLSWFVGRGWDETRSDGSIAVSDDYFTDLSLQLWSMDEDGEADSMVAVSDAEFINTEHFSFALDETGDYFLRVNWEGERYDSVDNSLQTYGLAWNSVAVGVPEPRAAGLMLAVAMLISGRRRRQSSL